MPTPLNYPGVYIEEIPSGVRTITGVATSITAFIGRTLKGEENKPITINSFGDFERIFGGLWAESALGFAVRDFFLNGGNQAIIVRLFNPYTDEKNKDAKNAAEAVKEAPPGENAEDAAKAAAEAARKKANEYTKDPEKTAADIVARAVENEAAKKDATTAKVKDAAKEAAATEDELRLTEAKFEVDTLKLKAASKGSWGNCLRISVDVDVSKDAADVLGLGEEVLLFNMTIKEDIPGGRIERFVNLTVGESPRRIDKVLLAESKLLLWSEETFAKPDNLGEIQNLHSSLRQISNTLEENSDKLKTKSDALKDAIDGKKTKEEIDQARKDVDAARKDVDAARKDVDAARKTVIDAKRTEFALDGTYLTKESITGSQEKKEGLYALEKADLFNILCIPPYDLEVVSDEASLTARATLIDEAAAYCERRRAMLLVDPPIGWKDKDTAKNGVENVGTRSKNAALFFPRLKQPNPLRDNQMEDFVPCGAVAGIFARTDTQRGIWKAPAGLDATLLGVPKLSVPLTDSENGELNQLGINCLRDMPPAGRVIWGSRTLQGDDRLASEWKYIPVRRMALFIEESLYRGTKWVVFEPNDEPLWAQIRLNIGAFMHNLFRQGAFQGSTPREAYFVKCDKETTTQNDINLGIVNIIVGFAPLKPAEFVVIKLQQMAGEIQT